MKTSQKKIVTNGDMSATLTSTGFDLQDFTHGSLHAVFSGSPVGALSLQVSNDICAVSQTTDPGANVTTWTDYSGSSQSISAAGDFLYNLAILFGYRWVRLKYTKTSGTGTLNVTIFCKNPNTN